MNNQTFAKKLNSLVRRTKTVRDDIQQLVEYGFDQAAQHGNLSPLTALLLAVRPLKTVRTATLEKYIFDHVSGIQWGNGAGTQKVLRKTEGLTIEVSNAICKWYEHDNEGVEVRTLDIHKRIKSLINDIKRVSEHKNVVLLDGQQELADQVLAVLSAFEEGDVDVNITEAA